MGASSIHALINDKTISPDQNHWLIIRVKGHPPPAPPPSHPSQSIYINAHQIMNDPLFQFIHHWHKTSTHHILCTSFISVTQSIFLFLSLPPSLPPSLTRSLFLTLLSLIVSFCLPLCLYVPLVNQLTMRQSADVWCHPKDICDNKNEEIIVHRLW